MTSPSEQRRTASGFTLFELLIVLAIMGLMTALVVVRGPLVSHRLTMRQTASALAGGLREARSQAIGDDRPVTLTVDIGARTYAVGKHRSETLPGRFAIQVMAASGEIRSGSVARFRFEPDGSSSGGRIVLSEPGQKMQIGVDWLNGRVRVVDGD